MCQSLSHLFFELVECDFVLQRVTQLSGEILSAQPELSAKEQGFRTRSGKSAYHPNGFEAVILR